MCGKRNSEFTSMLQLLRLAFRVSLYLLKGLPWLHCPSFSCPYSSIFGILSSSIRTMCPVHLSWYLMIKHCSAGEAALLQDLEVGHSVLPLDVADLAQTSLVKLLQLLDVLAVSGPRLAAIQKCAQDHSSVYGNLGGEADVVVLPKSLCLCGLPKVSLSVGLRPHLPFQSAASPQRPGIHCL